MEYILEYESDQELELIQEVEKLSISNNIKKKYILYFDGASKGNPGPSGCGAVLYEQEYGGNNLPTKKEIWSDALWVGEKETNNVAEYNGLILGLKEIVNRGIKEVDVFGDSMLVINQMKGTNKVNANTLIPLYKKAVELQKKIGEVYYQHVYRENNKRADELSNIPIKEMK